MSAAPYYLPEEEGGSFCSMAFLECRRWGMMTDEADRKGTQTGEPPNRLNPCPREGPGGATPASCREQSFMSI